jgi:hypothetical protein
MVRRASSKAGLTPNRTEPKETKMDAFTLQELARIRQNEFVEQGLRQARLRWTRPAAGRPRFTLRLIPMTLACVAILVRLVALTLGF